MSKNILSRTVSTNSQESYVYEYTQYQDSSFVSQRLSSIRTSPSANNITRPFGKTTGQWRVLNLKIDPTGGYGGEDGAALSFGFSKAQANDNLSAACGFVLGLPPLHATHVNTVTRSICYGFIINPFTSGVDDLYIVHENNLSLVPTGTPYSSLRIEIKNNVVVYKSGSGVLATRTISNTSMVLHVVGALGFQGNQITDLSLSGGSPTSFSSPNFSKEIYIPCLGLTSVSQNPISLQDPIGIRKPILNSDVPDTAFGVFTNVQVKGTSGKTFTVHYPNGTTKAFNTFTTEPFVSVDDGNISTFSPFTLKIVFDSLNDLKGLIVANPLISSELSLDRSLQHLTMLEHIEVRSSFSNTFNAFYPTIGENLPLPQPNSKLRLASIEGSYEVKEHDLSRQQELTNLFLSTPVDANTFPKVTAARKLTYFEIESTQNNWFLENFRNIFRDPRDDSSHGVRRNVGGSSSTLSVQNTEALAISQQSYQLMYGLSVVQRENTAYFSPNQGSGFNITNQWTRRRIVINGVDLDIRDYIFEGISTTSNSEQQIVFYAYPLTSIPSADQLFCIRTSGHINSGTLNHQLRRIANAQQELVTKTINSQLVPYYKYTIVTKKTKEELDLTGLNVVNNSSSQPNTFAVTKTNNPVGFFDEVQIGDTVWDLWDLVGNPSVQELTYNPAIVIRKEDNGNRLIVLQSENGSVAGSTISAGNNKNLRFRWEWSLLTPQILTTPSQGSDFSYPTDIKQTDTLTFTSTTSGTTTDVFTNSAAAFQYLVSVSGI